MNLLVLDAVSPVVIRGVALGFVVVVAIAAFILLSIVAFIQKKYQPKENR